MRLGFPYHESFQIKLKLKILECRNILILICRFSDLLIFNYDTQHLTSNRITTHIRLIPRDNRINISSMRFRITAKASTLCSKDRKKRNAIGTQLYKPSQCDSLLISFQVLKIIISPIDVSRSESEPIAERRDHSRSMGASLGLSVPYLTSQRDSVRPRHGR